MDNNHMRYEKSFHKYKQQPQLLAVGDDFENIVFAKIKKRKTQRKVATSVTLGFVLLAFIFIAQITFFNNNNEESEPVLASQTDMTVPDNAIKEEVPVMEDVIYASSDSRASYAIEQVAYYEDQKTF